MAEKVLQLENLSFSYPQKPVFANIELSIEKGQIFALLGPNGCGKTTLLHCILNLIKPSQGLVRLAGQPVADMKSDEIARQMAYVPQSHRKTFAYTVREIVLMGRAAYAPAYSAPGREDVAIAESALTAVGIGSFADKPFTQLSGGESQLVLLARALAQQSRIILLDEPTAHLDSYHELMVMDKLASLARECGLTVVMTTHFPNQALYLMNQGIPLHGALMKDGKIMRCGRGEEIFTQESIADLYRIKCGLAEFRDEQGRNMRHFVPYGIDDRS